MKDNLLTRSKKLFITIIKFIYLARVHIIALAVATSFSGYLAVSLGQDANYDLYNYHYNNPYSLLNNASEKQFAVSGVLSQENPVRDIPAYLLMSNLSSKKSAFLIGAAQGLNIWLIFEIALVVFKYYKYKNKSAIIISAIISIMALFGAGNQSVIGTTMGDNTTSIFVLLALLFLLHSLDIKSTAKKSKTLRILSFISLGISVGLKLTNIVYAVAFFGSIILLLLMKQTGVKEKLRCLLIDFFAFITGLLTISGFWMYQNYINYGNPIFPFYNGIFKSEYYPAVNFIDGRWINSSAINALLEPFSYFSNQSISSEVAFADPRLALTMVSIGMIIALSVYEKRKLPAKDLFNNLTRSPVFIIVTFTALSYIVWAIQFSYYRYIMIVEMLSVLLIAIIISKILRHKQKLVIFCLIFVSLYLFIVTQQTSWGRIPFQDTNFGIKQQDFEILNNSAVLIAGYGPYSFMLPYFPESTKTIRVVSNLSHTETGVTESMDQLINDKIESSRQSQSEFYGLYADEEYLIAFNSFQEHGFKIGECSEVPVTVRIGLSSKYRLCKLWNQEVIN